MVLKSEYSRATYPDSKVHGANMGPTWVLSAPDGPHVGRMILAIRVVNTMAFDAWVKQGVLSVQDNQYKWQHVNVQCHQWWPFLVFNVMNDNVLHEACSKTSHTVGCHYYVFQYNIILHKGLRHKKSRNWINKRHPIPNPNGLAMECLPILMIFL